MSPKLVAGLMKSIGLPISDVQLTALVLPNNTLFRCPQQTQSGIRKACRHTLHTIEVV